MTDRLTQLQDAVDQLATQFFSALRYVSTHHDQEQDANTTNPPNTTPNTNTTPPNSKPESSQEGGDEQLNIEAAMRELARDLVVKSKQIEVLITSLPGIGVSEDEQRLRMHALQEALIVAEEERRIALERKEMARKRVESVVVGLKRI
jgi:mediator of RNA polymerase II transcription subunit 21